MLQAGNINHITPFLTTVSQSQVEAIMGAAYLILEQTGCTVDHPLALKLLSDAGARVDGNRVTVPRHVIQNALALAPKGFVMYNRDGQPAMDLTGNNSYFGTSTASPNQRHAWNISENPPVWKILNGEPG